MAGLYDESGAYNVAIVEEGSVTGTTADAAETDPAEDATVIALLKGILTALNTIAVNTTPAP